jgi:OOP family OmpA-OmpF porin
MRTIAKPICAVILSLGTLVATSASAEGNGYWGIGIGQGHASVPTASGTFTGTTYTASAAVTEGKTSDTAYKLYLGYQYTPNWGIEVGYNDIGRNYSAHLAGSITPTEGSPTVFAGDASARIDNWYVAAVGTLPFGNGFSLLGKLGAVRSSVRGENFAFCASGSTTVCGSASLGTSRHSDLLLGAGAEYAFSKQWSVRVEYEDYGKASEDVQWGNGTSGAIKTHSWDISLKGSF